MNSNNKELFEKFKEITASYNFIKRDAYSPKKEKEVNIMKRKIIATACASLVLVSGIVFASNIINKNKDDRGLGQGIETAIENGYIVNPEMHFINFDNKGTKIKIEDFLMDNSNLSIKFTLEFDEVLNNTIDLEKIYHIELNDLIIRDEENRIIYAGHLPDRFKEYCIENNLNYEYAKFNENYINSGLNAYIDNKSENTVNLIYNIYTEDNFPKSKKLYFSFKTVTLYMMPIEQGNTTQLTGEWYAEVDIPENMYSRTVESYKVVNCDNKNLNVYTAIATDTGFEIGVIMPEKDGNKSVINKIESYIENENGDKFDFSSSVSRKVETEYLEGNSYKFYETFEMTKYDATDKLKVILDYYGSTVTIRLEKIK